MVPHIYVTHAYALGDGIDEEAQASKDEEDRLEKGRSQKLRRKITGQRECAERKHSEGGKVAPT